LLDDKKHFFLGLLEGLQDSLGGGFDLLEARVGVGYKRGGLAVVVRVGLVQ